MFKVGGQLCELKSDTICTGRENQIHSLFGIVLKAHGQLYEHLIVAANKTLFTL